MKGLGFVLFGAGIVLSIVGWDVGSIRFIGGFVLGGGATILGKAL